MIDTIIGIGAIVVGILLSLSHFFQLKKILKVKKSDQISKMLYGIIVIALAFYAFANLYRGDIFMFISFMIGLVPATSVFVLSFVYDKNKKIKKSRRSKKRWKV